MNLLKYLAELSLLSGEIKLGPPWITRRRVRGENRRSIVIDGKRHPLRGLARTLKQDRVEIALRNARDPGFGLKFVHPRTIRRLCQLHGCNPSTISNLVIESGTAAISATHVNDLRTLTAYPNPGSTPR